MDPSSLAALSAYEPLAPVYDALTADYDHAGWLGALDHLARDQLLPGRRALDVACGTGKSTLPLVERGYDVTACDLSPSMLAQARAKAGLERGRVFEADMRHLPEGGPFDLVTCLDDALNHLLDPKELTAAMRSAATLLAPGGLYVFDTNTLRTFRTAFASSGSWAQGTRTFTWNGHGRPDAGPGTVARAEITVVDDGPIASVLHLERHYPVETVVEAIRRAGLELAVVLGQTTGAVLHRTADELAHTKCVFVVRKPHGEGASMIKP